MVKLRPELFAAYVGTGQAESWSASMNMRYDMALAKARQDGDIAAVKNLETTGRPSLTDPKQAFSVNTWPAMAPSDKRWIQSLRADLPALQAKYPKDMQDYQDGFQFSVDHALPDQMKLDLPKTASSIGTAFFIIQGQDDIMTPTPAAVEYFKLVKAPKKELVLIPDAGHFAFMTAPDAFQAALVNKVRPVAVANGG